VTVIQGDKDKFVPMENAAFAQKMLVNAPEVKIVMIPNGSHFILWTEYEKVVQEILDILNN
jgi:pimeloyl-ACP methyl ester carboxylesterase